MDDLVAFLKARLDERMRTALAAGATPGRRRWAEAPGGVDDAEHSSVVRWEGRGAAPSDARAQHIAANDPAYVLEDIEMKRRLIEQYQLLAADLLPSAGREYLLAEYRYLIATMALPFADHSEYRDRWRPAYPY
ncbi:DUF6221 family protein [Nocardiopsis coralliicola]